MLGQWGILTGPRGTFGPFDLACGARGHDYLMELIEQPDRARRLLDKAVDAAIWYGRQTAQRVPRVDGGTIIPYFGMWLPGVVVGHVSVDYGIMISRSMLEEFLLPYEQRFASAFPGAAYHLHNGGWHQIDAVSRIPNLRILEMTDDPSEPRSAGRYPELLDACGQTPVLIYPRPQEVYDNIDLLARHNVVISMTAANLGADDPVGVARDLVKLVRDRSKG